MLKDMGIFFGIIGICVVIGGIVLLNAEDSYSGKMVLYGQDAEDFKVAISDSEVNVVSLQTMTSDPAYVNFTVTVPKGHAFRFGSVVGILGQRSFGLIIGGIFLMVICLVGRLINNDIDKQYRKVV